MKIIRIVFNLLRFDRADWWAVFLCIAIATVFWFFNAFNKEYSSNLRFPILFEFDGEQYVAANHLPKTITVNVSAKGWDIVRKQIGLKLPQLTIPLARPTEIKKIAANSLLPLIAAQLQTLKVNSIVTDTLHVEIDKRVKHRYRLIADISKITFQEGYGRTSPVVVLPDSIILDGAENILRKLNDTILVSIDDKNIGEDFRDEAEIIFAGSEFVKRNPSVAQVLFEVGEVEIVNRKLKVQLDKNIDIKIADSVAVQFQIPINRVADFNLQAKEIICEVNSRLLKKNKVASPKLLNVPSYSIVLKTDSVYLKD